MIINHPWLWRELAADQCLSVLSSTEHCRVSLAVFDAARVGRLLTQEAVFTLDQIAKNVRKENCHPHSDFGVQISLGFHRDAIAELEHELKPFESLSFAFTTNLFLFLIKIKKSHKYSKKKLFHILCYSDSMKEGLTCFDIRCFSLG